MDRPIFTEYVKKYDTNVTEADYLLNKDLERYCGDADKYIDELLSKIDQLRTINLSYEQEMDIYKNEYHKERERRDLLEINNMLLLKQIRDMKE